MIKFIFKGVLRDKNRSLLPIIVVFIGAFLTVLLSGWMKGIFGDMITINANQTTGHVKIMTRAYAENQSQLPNDLALIGVDTLLPRLSQKYPEMSWVARIEFGGLLDIPDRNGETRAQGPAFCKAVDLLSPHSGEIDRMDISSALVKGHLPHVRGEILISNKFADKFDVKPGDSVTLFGSTMTGGMMIQSFRVSGTINFGSTLLDRGAVIMDIKDAQQALDMKDAASEILGYFKTGEYDDENAEQIKKSFNTQYRSTKDPYAPQMFKLRDQNNLGQYLDLANHMSSIMVFIFIVAMSIVLWNAGLLSGLRRYGEFGIRLALGEEKKHIYKTVLYESVLIGLIGSIIGTIFGLISVYYLQEVGLNFSSMMKNVTMLMPHTYRAKVTPDLFYIGFFPGLIATTLGTAIAGIAIFRRKTAQLFKELEV